MMAFSVGFTNAQKPYFEWFFEKAKDRDFGDFTETLVSSWTGDEISKKRNGFYKQRTVFWGPLTVSMAVGLPSGVLMLRKITIFQRQIIYLVYLCLIFHSKLLVYRRLWKKSTSSRQGNVRGMSALRSPGSPEFQVVDQEDSPCPYTGAGASWKSDVSPGGQNLIHGIHHGIHGIHGIWWNFSVKNQQMTREFFHQISDPNQIPWW